MFENQHEMRRARDVCRFHFIKRWRSISILSVEGDRRRPCAIRRIDRPAAIPREISSRSSRLSAPAALRRGSAAMPPIESQDTIDTALVPALKRPSDIRHTLTVLPALPKLSPLLRREPYPCSP